MFGLLLQAHQLYSDFTDQSPGYGEWVVPGILTEPEKGIYSEVQSGFTECPLRGCANNLGVFGPHGLLAGREPPCWAEGICQRAPMPNGRVAGPD